MKINRSEFLSKTITAITAVSAIGSLSAQSSNKKNLSVKKVTVVGAGIAGLYSAYLLKNSGYEVSIVEAKNRFGGRVLTISNDESQLTSELGAEWIQENHFTIKSLCKELGIELKAYPVMNDILLGDNLIESNLVKPNSQTREIIKRVISLFEKMSPEKKVGLDKLDIYSFLKYQGVTEEELYLLDMKYSVILGENIRTISAEKAIALFEFTENGSPFQYKIQTGSEKIIDSLKSNLKGTNFIISDPIISIEDLGNGVILKSKSGKSISSDACIIAIPSSQLNKIKIYPDLPKEHKLALLQLRMSRITKVSALYKGIDYVRDKLYIQGDGVFQNIYSNGVKNKAANKGILTLLSSGDRADTYSRLSTEYLPTFVKQNLDSIELLSTLKLEKIDLKAWQNEPFIEGANSIYAPGTFDVKSILKKNHGRVHFAGEHLGKYNGTMEGALLSAIDAVNGI